MGILRRMAARGLAKVGFVPKETMEAAVRQQRDRGFRAATMISDAALPVMARDLFERGDEAHRAYNQVVRGLEMLQ